MSIDRTTLAGLAARLDELPGDLAVAIDAAGTIAKPGFHITEIKMAQYHSLDCGGQPHIWREAVVQILDGGFGAPMQTAKLGAILRKSIAAQPAMADVPVQVEFGSANGGLALFHLAGPDVSKKALTLRLQPTGAECKAANNSGEAAGAQVQSSVQPETKGCCA